MRGSIEAGITASRPSVTGEAHTGLLAFANERYGTNIDQSQPNAYDLAASIIWGRDLCRVAIRDLPEVQ